MLCFFPSRTVLPPGPPRSSGQLFSARGPSEPSVLVRDVPEWSVLFACFSVGFLVEETPCEHMENMQTPCEHGENMQTPHRKAREIAHLSTVHSGEDLPPRANSTPCGNQTH